MAGRRPTALGAPGPRPLGTAGTAGQAPAREAALEARVARLERQVRALEQRLSRVETGSRGEGRADA